MNAYWLYETHGDPLKSVQEIVGMVWEQAGLQGVLAPFAETGSAESVREAYPRLLEDPVQLAQINPFRPSMRTNAAGLIPALLRDRPGERLGAVLRPCELRALASIQERAGLSLDNLVTISVDCLATFPTEDLSWRSARKHQPEHLTQDALRFARQGGVSSYRYRPACQICSSQAGDEADFSIGVLGLPVRRHMLVLTPAEISVGRQYLENFISGRAFPAGSAPESLVSQRERILSRQIERHERTRERLSAGMASLMPGSLQMLADQLESCGGCEDCMDVCPICSVSRPQRDAAGHFRAEDLACWMLSCSGCGMCEQACPNRLPLSTVFAHLRDELQM
jgi:formate dehydrogenase (coenzyme F420) beta subunit